MAKEDRVMQALETLVNSGCALPPVVIFRNAKLRGATFERRSVNNYLRELHDRGLIEKVDPEGLEDGDLISVDPSEDGYFIATKEGRKRIQKNA